MLLSVHVVTTSVTTGGLDVDDEHSSYVTYVTRLGVSSWLRELTLCADAPNAVASTAIAAAFMAAER